MHHIGMVAIRFRILDELLPCEIHKIYIEYKNSDKE
jgi:hypothetical protein